MNPNQFELKVCQLIKFNLFKLDICSLPTSKCLSHNQLIKLLKIPCLPKRKKATQNKRNPCPNPR